jgi:aryl-alcohol dehydrogenase-like predicted oxidoreductase
METQPKKLNCVPLGKNGPLIPRIGLGCMGMSAYYGSPPPEEECLALLNRAIDLGCTYLDTADIYGENEVLLSKILATRRNEIFIASKFGAFVFNPLDQPKYFHTPGHPEYVRISVERSLKRLGVSRIDLYYMHRMDPNTPIEITIKSLVDLINEGKLKYLGLSECSGETLRRAHAVHPITAVQMEYSPWSIDIEHNGLLQTARELGVGIVAYSPLGRGFLSGRFKTHEDLDVNDYRRIHPRFSGDNFAKNYQIVEEFNKISKQLDIPISQVVLSWILAQGNDFFVIPGTTNITRLEENLGSDSVVLSKDITERIRNLINGIEIKGGRYDDASLLRCNI